MSMTSRPLGRSGKFGPAARGRDIKLSISTEHCATESLNVEDFYAAPCAWCAATVDCWCELRVYVAHMLCWQGDTGAGWGSVASGFAAGGARGARRRGVI